MKRSAVNTVIGAPYNSNEQPFIAELVIVVDNGFYREMNKKLHRVHEYCKNIANIINSVSTKFF